MTTQINQYTAADLEGLTPVGVLRQTQYPLPADNLAIVAYQLPRGEILICDVDPAGPGAQTITTKLGGETVDDVLAHHAAIWAGHSDQKQLERVRWHLDALDDVCVGVGHRGAVMVMITRHYYGSQTTDYVCDEGDPSSPVVFAASEEADTWISEQEEGIYHLAHNEFARPRYTIVAEIRAQS